MQFIDYVERLVAAENLMKENPRPGSFLHFQGRIILVLSVNGKSSITFVEGSRVSTIWAMPTFISKPGEHEFATRKPEALMGNGYISALTTWRLMKEIDPRVRYEEDHLSRLRWRPELTGVPALAERHRLRFRVA